MTKKVLQVNLLCNEIRDELLSVGVSLEEMLAELRHIREVDGRVQGDSPKKPSPGIASVSR